MTREDVIKRIKRILEECKEYNEDDEIAVCYVTPYDADALEMAIKALEQETVSRQSYDHEYSLRKEYEVKIAKLEKAIETLEQEPRWIPCSKKMPKENEYVDGVCKYYLIQDEYGDMHVAHRTNTGWRLLDGLSVLYDNVVAWRPLPEIYTESIS